MLALGLRWLQRIADFADIGDGFAADIEDDITGFKTLLGRRTVRIDRSSSISRSTSVRMRFISAESDANAPRLSSTSSNPPRRSTSTYPATTVSGVRSS